MRKIIVLLSLFFIISSLPLCKGGQKKKGAKLEGFDKDKFENYSIDYKQDDDKGLIINVLDEEKNIVPPGAVKSAYLFENLPRNPKEVFRVLVTPDDYIIKQWAYEKFMSREEDKQGDQMLLDELKEFDLVDFSDDMMVQIILSIHNGNPLRISVEKVSRIQAMTKKLYNDVSRWKYKFKTQTIVPKKFQVRYFYALKGKGKTMTREEVKAYLKKKEEKK